MQCDRQLSGTGRVTLCQLRRSPLPSHSITALVPHSAGHRQRQDGGRRQALPQAQGHGGEASSQSLPQEHVRPHRGGQESHSKTEPVSCLATIALKEKYLFILFCVSVTANVEEWRPTQALLSSWASPGRSPSAPRWRPS